MYFLHVSSKAMFSIQVVRLCNNYIVKEKKIVLVEWTSFMKLKIHAHSKQWPGNDAEINAGVGWLFDFLPHFTVS